MIQDTTVLKKTPLYEEHLALKAKMAPFAGWNMPIHYEGILREHQHTRNSVSLFDICHMGEFYIKADPSSSGLERIFSFSVSLIPVKRCRYGAMLNDEGGVKDDLIVYRISADEWMVVVNSATTEKDAAHIKEQLGKGAYFEDLSPKLAKLDLQGPLSREVITSSVNPDAGRLGYYSFDYFDVLGERNIISRTGYTGELGYEIYVSREKAGELWRKLAGHEKVRPAGLGARDTLRLEMGYTLYGRDVDEKTTPLEANLKRYVNLEKDFIGKDALIKQQREGIKKVLAAFKTRSRRAPRHGYEIRRGGITVGTVTSGSFSPSLSVGIGLGYMDAEVARPGERISVRNAAVEIEAEVSSKPFLQNTSLHS